MRSAFSSFKRALIARDGPRMMYSRPLVLLSSIIEKLKYFAPSLSSLRFFISAINVPISAGTKWLITALRLTTFDTARTPSRNISIFYTGAYLSTLHQIFTNIPEGEYFLQCRYNPNWCHRTGKRCRETTTPLYCLRRSSGVYG